MHVVGGDVLECVRVHVTGDVCEYVTGDVCEHVTVPVLCAREDCEWTERRALA